MSDTELPTLVKPYYTLEECFKRIVLAGGELGEPDDLFLVAQEGGISLSLLLDEEVYLVRVEYGIPEKFKVEPKIVIAEDTIKQFIYDYGGSQQKAKQVAEDYNRGCWIVPHRLRNPSAELLQHPIIMIDSAHSIPIKPYEIGVEPENGIDAVRYLHPHNFEHPQEYLIKNSQSLLENRLVAGEWNGNFYFLCRRFDHDGFIEGFNRFEVKIGDEVFRPEYLLDRKVLVEMIRKENHVVTREDLLDFESRMLGIEHENVRTNSPSYLNPDSDIYAEELAIAVETHQAIFEEKQGRQALSLGNRIDNWLRTNYPNRSGAFYDRIKTVVMPKQKVG